MFARKIFSSRGAEIKNLASALPRRGFDCAGVPPRSERAKPFKKMGAVLYPLLVDEVDLFVADRLEIVVILPEHCSFRFTSAATHNTPNRAQKSIHQTQQEVRLRPGKKKTASRKG